MSSVIKYAEDENTELENGEFSQPAKEQEISHLMELLNSEFKKNVHYKVIYSILKEYASQDDNSNQNLKTKINNILSSHNASQTIMINSSRDNRHNILGIEDITSSVAISYADRNILFEILRSKVVEKRTALEKHLCKLKLENGIDKCSDIKKENYSSALLNASPDDRCLMDYREKLLFEQEKYVNQLLELKRLLLELIEIRLKELPEIAELKIKQYQVKDKINQLKSVFTKAKCQMEIFTETTYSLKAYTNLMDDVKKQQEEYQNEIETLQELKKKYAEVSSKQYNEILQSYVQYKTSIEKKKILYNCLKS